MTRTEYMKTPTASSHRAYYAQYVTVGLISFVARGIGIDVILASTDEHMNDIPLGQWDVLALQVPLKVVEMLKSNGDFLSLGTGVCILKEAARQIKERATR